MAAPDTTTLMNNLVGCVVEALDQVDRPVCDHGLTIGPPVIGLEQCCTCDTASGQVTANLERWYPADGVTFEQVTRTEPCRPGPVAADLTLVVTRCYPRVDDTGHMPELVDTTGAAEDLNTDMGAVWQALLCCGTKLVIRESAVDADPDGGCSAFAVRVTALITVPPSPVGVGS